MMAWMSFGRIAFDKFEGSSSGTRRRTRVGGNLMSTTKVWILTAKDRCDRCGARAYFKATLPGLPSLLFCAHHGLEHKSKLEANGARILDETEQLAPLVKVLEDAP
jgi:hypothetical protein